LLRQTKICTTDELKLQTLCNIAHREY